jgi:hypothetical protein
MHPYFLQSLAAERTRDMRKQATTMRSARQARRNQSAGPAGGVTRRTGHRLVHGAVRF